MKDKISISLRMEDSNSNTKINSKDNFQCKIKKHFCKQITII